MHQERIRREPHQEQERKEKEKRPFKYRMSLGGVILENKDNISKVLPFYIKSNRIIYIQLLIYKKEDDTTTRLKCMNVSSNGDALKKL